jgi:hypothetical protein
MPGVPDSPTRPAAAAPATQPRRVRRVVAAVLLVVGALLTPITILTLFVNTQVTNTGRYVQTMKPLARDAALQAYIAGDVTNQLFTQVDVEQYVRGVLPARARPLAAPVATAMKTFTYDAVLRVLASDQFQHLWVAANRVAHAQLVAVLTNERHGKVLTTSNGAVTVDLSPLADSVKQRLAQRGISVFDKIPANRVSGKITLFESKDLYRARRAVGLLTKLAYVLPFVVFACFGGAIILSRDRRRAFIRAAIAFTVGAAVLALGLAFGRGIYLDAAVNGGIPHDAAAAVYDILVRSLHTAVRTVLSFSVIVVVAAVFSGPSRLAVSFRGTVQRVVSWLGRQSADAGWRWLEPIGFVRSQGRTLRIVVAAAGFVLLFFWKHPTPSVIFWIAVGALFLLALVEFFGRDREAVAVGSSAGAR